MLTSLTSVPCEFCVNQIMSNRTDTPRKPENCGSSVRMERLQEVSLQLGVKYDWHLRSLVRINQREKWAGCTQEN